MDSTAFSAEEHFRRGSDALDAGEHASALEDFRAAARLDSANATYRSYLGLATGLAERRLDQALELCREAAREEFFNPGHYLNLARLHMAFGFKSEAVRLLRRGLMIDPSNEQIAAAMSGLGVRRRPPVAFLRRQHAVNRWAGWLLHRLGVDPEPAELRAFGL
jgi:tetratricopeptide (TPR) repeat protein